MVLEAVVQREPQEVVLVDLELWSRSTPACC